MKILHISFDVPAVVDINFEMDKDEWEAMSEADKALLAQKLMKKADHLLFNADSSDGNMSVNSHIPSLSGTITFEIEEWEIDSESDYEGAEDYQGDGGRD